MIRLRELSISDTDHIVSWRNKNAVKRWLFSQKPLTREQHLSYFSSMIQTKKIFQYVICVENGDTCFDIGTVFLKNIDYESKKAEFGIFIGEDSCRGKGYAKFAVYEILKIVFQSLNLNRVYLSVMKDNLPAICLYRKIGFLEEGILREDYIRDNEAVDIVMMAILKNEFVSCEHLFAGGGTF